MRNSSAFIALAATALTLLTAESFALGGTVRNAGGTPLARAQVSLVSDTAARHVTDSTGAFSLTPTSLVFRPGAGAAGHAVDGLSLQAGILRFDLVSSAAKGSVSLFSGDGAKLFESPVGPLSVGHHQLKLPRLTPGLYYLRFALDGRISVVHLATAGEAGAVAGRHAQPQHSSARSASAANERSALARAASTAATAAVDTLLVKRVGYVTTKFPVTSYGQSDMSVVLPADTVSPLAPVSDYSVNGPYATVVEANVGPGNNYTIVRPATLGANGFRHAPIIYGHGINGQVSGFTAFLQSVASHGFVIIARNVLTGGPNNAGNTAAMNDGLNWILAQDTTAGSMFFGKLATDRAASMGYSVGGTAAVDIGGHPALRTVVSIHGHISNATLNGTLLQTSGTQDNVGLPMQQQTYDSSDVQTFLATVTGANHGYISSNNGGVQRAAIIAWLRYWIYNDQGARPYFYGNDCILCAAPWENPQRKNWD